MIFAFSFSFLESIYVPIDVQAYGDDNPIVVVSMGDSYSAGEGIEPFYGQKNADGIDLPRQSKIHSADWFAHRSTESWPSLLKIGDLNVRDYKKDIDGLSLPSPIQSNEPSPCEWYFVAATGAVTDNFDNPYERGPVKTRVSGGLFNAKYIEESNTASKLDPQLKVFEANDLYGKVDYVTMTIGGNDLGFAEIVEKSIKYTLAHNPTLMKNLIAEKRRLWFTEVKQKLIDTYKKVYTAAGPQADIIVAGYPELYYRDKNTWAAGKEQRKIIDDFVVEFCDKDNGRIKKTIDECNLQFTNGKIHYVSVIDEFLGHGSDAPNGNEWINGITLTGTQMIDESDITQKKYPSMHPNEEGAKAYARCVNAKIQEIEESKRKGTLSGKICKASDRNTAISGATINVYKDNNLYLTETSDADGNYSMELPIGRYYIKITADGYIGFNSYATVVYDTNTYMETFLMIEGSEDEKGIAKGKIVNSLTGFGTDGVNLSVVKDWNNTLENSEAIATATTDSSGYYSFELPLGNYTVIASKDGYLSTSFNIIVQTGTTDNQNGIIMPQVSGDEYLITLTWGENPSDLDSHVEGTLSNGDLFHVYYSYMKQDDGNIEVCRLDYDDTTSFGPEHTTLKITTDKPYYYYVYKYAGTGTVANSGAKITVHKGNELIGTYNVPTNLGNGDYWNVFAIRNGELVVKNTITDTPDISYGEQQNGYDIYENADIYVADSIINGMYEKSTGKNSSEKLLQMSLDRKYTYNLLAEYLCDDYMLSFNSMFWQNIEKTLSFDFISMANWKEMYYEIILMDYLTYSTEQSDFVDEFTLEASSRAADIIMDIFQNQSENVTSDMSQLTDKLKGLSSSWAEEWAEEVDYIKKSDRDTEIFSKGLLNGVTTAYDFIENLSKYLTLKDCKDSTIAYLQKIKEQASVAGDEDLCKAIDSIVKKYNDSFATLVLKDTWEETYKQLSPIVFEGLIKDGIQKSPEVFAKVFGKITGKSTSEIKKLAEGLAEGSTESFDQIMIILKSETFALDLLFNSKDISDANLKLLEFYIISCYSNSAIRDLRDDFLNHKSKETARTFINGFFEYLHFQRYFTRYSYEFVSLSTKEGIWNRIKNFLFETKNEKLYDELTGYLDDDQSFNKNISEAANELYKIHSIMYGGRTIIDSETGISVSGNIEAGTTVEVVPIMVMGADGTEGYEITLVKNGKVIQPPKDVLVTIKSNTPNIFVYFVDENGNKINMKTEYCDGCYVFRTSV